MFYRNYHIRIYIIAWIHQMASGDTPAQQTIQIMKRNPEKEPSFATVVSSAPWEEPEKYPDNRYKLPLI